MSNIKKLLEQQRQEFDEMLEQELTEEVFKLTKLLREKTEQLLQATKTINKLTEERNGKHTEKV